MTTRIANPAVSTHAYRRAGMMPPTDSTQAISRPPGLETLAILDDSPLGLRVSSLEESGRLMRVFLAGVAMQAVPGFDLMLLNRVQTVGALRHPCILPLSRFERSTASLVSPHVRGFEPLSAVVLRRGALPFAEALTIAMQIATTLDDLARSGITHGWLRPECILVNPANQVLIDDLWLAKPLGWLLDQPVHEDIHWLAPETLDGRQWGVPTDIFGLGAVLLFCLTGKPLLAGRTARTAIEFYAASEPQVLLDWQRTAPPERRALIQSMIAPRIQDRLGSWTEVRERIQRLLTVKVLQPKVNPSERLVAVAGPAPAASLNYLFAGVAVGVCAALIVGVIIYNTAGQRPAAGTAPVADQAPVAPRSGTVVVRTPVGEAPANAAAAPAHAPADQAAVASRTPLDLATPSVDPLAHGWTPYGGGRGDGQEIRLPALPVGRSGLSRTVAPSEHGWTIAARGRGQVLLKLASEQKGDEKWSTFSIPLPGDPQKPMHVTVLWDGQNYRLRNNKGDEVGREQFTASPTRFTIEGDGEVILAELPTPAHLE